MSRQPHIVESPIAPIIEAIADDEAWQSNLTDEQRKVWMRAARDSLIHCRENDGDLNAEHERLKRVLSYVNWCYSEGFRLSVSVAV